jgi:hypothetical protein
MHTNKGTEASMKGRKPGLFISSGQFPCRPWYHTHCSITLSFFILGFSHPSGVSGYTFVFSEADMDPEQEADVLNSWMFR